ncbi:MULTISPECIES: DUF6801 domain-containing protein [Actinomadura]|uniref:DUF6801 domain-containing protein n=1 Tax=Actinomadura yumaensis TaxID=111807 RepID=A0ABW2CJ15_9ACTN|nr:DUF6801 domain-containing protein [Actinomadura sp. J1-007]MWK34786.1 hypothetical protein [Actinomadura sp. J1-007]
MKTKKGSSLRRTLALGTAAGIGLGLTSVIGAGAASAAPVSLSLKYDCSYPLIGGRSLKLNVKTDIPKKIQVGQSSGKIQVFWTADLGADTTEGLQAVDGATIEGSAVAQAKITSPERPNGVNAVVNNALQKTDIPSDGPFTISGYGEATPVKFTQAGNGKVTLGDMDLKVTVRKKDGSSSALGTFTAPCKQSSGQNNTVQDFEVTNDPGETIPQQPVPPYFPYQGQDEPAGTLNYNFNLAGKSHIKMANGDADLKGKIGVNVDGKTGAIKGPLTLNKSKGNFMILGFLYVTADIDFEQIGDTVGTYSDGVIATTSTMNIKLPSFNLFGTPIPLGGGANCKTTKPSEIKMGSAPGTFFNPKKGGAYTSPDYTIASINDCGPLTGILSLFTAGAGNTINMNLTP